MIFVNYLDISEVTMEQYEKFYLAASCERQRKADRYKNPEDSKRCILAEVLLRYSLFQTSPYKSEFTIEYNTCGKPRIKNIDKFFYNISHSGKWVVVAFGDSEVGVDVEKIGWNPGFEGILNKFYTEEERNYISSATDDRDKAERFAKIWTMKECYMKFSGVGLSKGLSSFTIDGRNGCVKDLKHKGTEKLKLKTYLLEDEYMLSICSEEECIRVNRVTEKEIDIIKRKSRLISC